MNRITQIKSFEQAVKKLRKTFRNIDSDMAEVKESLALTHKLPQSVKLKKTSNGAEVWKYRQRCRDLKKGKSGGYRIIAAMLNPEEEDKHIVLITVYIKKEKENLSETELNMIINEIEEYPMINPDFSPEKSGKS